MLPSWQKINLLLPMAILASVLSDSVYGQSSSSSSLKSVESYYLDKQRTNTSIMRSIPITHISPSRNKVTLAVEGGLIDTTVKGQDNYSYSSSDIEPEKMELGGYTFAPYLSLSLKNLGIGIAGETAVKTLKYTPQQYNNSYSYSQIEESNLDYSGLGIYLFLNPAPKSRKMRWNLVLGSKMLNVKHKVRSYYLNAPSSYSSSFDEEWLETKYTVQLTTFGTNVRVPLGKKVSIIPWVDYEIVNTSQLDSQFTDQSSVYYKANRFSTDTQIFWKARNPMQFGVDVAVKFGRFDIHIGDILGPIFSNEVEDPLYDDSGDISVSFSYDFKDR